MYKPKKINIDKLKQYLKRQKKNGEQNKLERIIQQEILENTKLDD